MSRTPTDPAHVRRHRLEIKLSLAEMELLRATARESGIPLRTFVRRCAIGQRLPQPVPKVNVELARELSRVGSNLNQLLHAINSGKAGEPPAVDLLQLQDLLAQVRRQLRGSAS
jgi:hypothetical protein